VSKIKSSVQRLCQNFFLGASDSRVTSLVCPRAGKCWNLECEDLHELFSIRQNGSRRSLREYITGDSKASTAMKVWKRSKAIVKYSCSIEYCSTRKMVMTVLMTVNGRSSTIYRFRTTDRPLKEWKNVFVRLLLRKTPRNNLVVLVVPPRTTRSTT